MSAKAATASYINGKITAYLHVLINQQGKNVNYGIMQLHKHMKIVVLPEAQLTRVTLLWSDGKYLHILTIQHNIIKMCFNWT